MQPPLHRIQLAPMAEARGSALGEVQQQLGAERQPGPALLDCADRPLTLPELRAVATALGQVGLVLRRVEALDALALVPAAALGLETALLMNAAPSEASGPGAEAPRGAGELTIHRGTLRAGDHLQVEGSVLVLGDVNPGARVTAAGDVRVWGRLRGVAHAGCQGDGKARIVALQLRPLQLRIAAAVARGPEDLPPVGFCEEALLEGSAITIQPADPHWPL